MSRPHDDGQPSRERNVRAWSNIDGRLLPLPFKCDVCHVEDACYGKSGELFCTFCWQDRDARALYYSKPIQMDGATLEWLALVEETKQMFRDHAKSRRGAHGTMH